MGLNDLATIERRDIVHTELQVQMHCEDPVLLADHDLQSQINAP